MGHRSGTDSGRDFSEQRESECVLIMARDADGVRRGAKWQENNTSTDGQPSDLDALYNAGDGYPSSFGEGGTDDPTRGEFNQVFKEITAVTTDVNKMRRYPRLALRDFLRTGCAREEVAEVLPIQDRHRKSQ